jgi:hypothetical protein
VDPKKGIFDKLWLGPFPCLDTVVRFDMAIDCEVCVSMSLALNSECGGWAKGAHLRGNESRCHPNLGQLAKSVKSDEKRGYCTDCVDRWRRIRRRHVVGVQGGTSMV